MGEERNPIFYVVFAIVIFMMAGTGYMFYKQYNEIHERMDRIEKKIEKDEEKVNEKKKTIKVPDVEGMTYEEAVKVLEDKGFEVGDVVIESGDIDGKVSKTIPSAGSSRQYGTVVTIYISE